VRRGIKNYFPIQNPEMAVNKGVQAIWQRLGNESGVNYWKAKLTKEC